MAPASDAAIAPAVTNGIDVNTIDAHQTMPSDTCAPTSFNVAGRPDGDRAAHANATQTNAVARNATAARAHPAGAARSGGKEDATILI